MAVPYASAEALLAAETLDFVDICTPPSSHGECIERALGAGLDVLCEKPLTISASDALRIAGKAAAAARIVHAVHNWLEAPVCRQVSALLAEGAVGNVHSISWDTSRTGPAAAVDESGTVNWRMDPEVAGGGILFDHGWHAAYCVARWAGAAPSAVSARLERRRYRASAVEDTAVLDIGFGRIDGHIHLDLGSRGTFKPRQRHWRCRPHRRRRRRGAACRRGRPSALGLPAFARRRIASPGLVRRHRRGIPDVLAGAAASNLGEAVACALLMDGAKASSAAGGQWLTIESLRQPIAA